MPKCQTQGLHLQERGQQEYCRHGWNYAWNLFRNYAVVPQSAKQTNKFYTNRNCFDSSLISLHVGTECKRQSQIVRCARPFPQVVKQADSANLHRGMYLYYMKCRSKHFTSLHPTISSSTQVTYLTHLACKRGMSHDRQAICPRKAGGKCESNWATSSLSRRLQCPAR